MNRLAATLSLALSLLATTGAITQAVAAAAATPRYIPEDNRPPLAFREDFVDVPNETPVTMASIKNKTLRFSLYGPGASGVGKTYHTSPKDESGFIWSGACTQICGFALRDPANYLDMRELSKITWRTKQTGLHQLRLMIKLAGGRVLVSEKSVGASSDWQVSDMTIQDIRWRDVDTKYMNDSSIARGAAPWATDVDLSRVDEVGWTDLQAGSGHGTMGGSSRVDWIEVYARKVPR